jgi:hydrogenase maturation factor
MCFILSDLKVMGALPQALEITLEVQRKMSNKEITRKKKPFQHTKHINIYFFSLVPSYFQTL